MIPHSFGMPSGFVRDFANNGSFLGKRDSKLSTYPSYTLNVPSGLLERYFIVPSGLLESIFLLASFFLPSSYLLSTFFLPTILYLPKEYFPHNLSQIQNFQFSSSKIANCVIVNCNICFAEFLEATPLLPSCYPLTIPTFNIRIDLDAFDLQKTSWSWHKLFQVSTFSFSNQEIKIRIFLAIFLQILLFYIDFQARAAILENRIVCNPRISFENHLFERVVTGKTIGSDAADTLRDCYAAETAILKNLSADALNRLGNVDAANGSTPLEAVAAQSRELRSAYQDKIDTLLRVSGKSVERQPTVFMIPSRHVGYGKRHFLLVADTGKVIVEIITTL